MKIHLFIICLLMILSPLVALQEGKCKDIGANIARKEIIISQVLTKAADIVGKKYRMKPIGQELGMPNSPTKFFGLDFQICGPLSKEKARKVLVGAACEIMGIINADSQVRPYLKTYPLTISNIEVSLFIKDKMGRALNDPHLGIAALINNELRYIVYIDGDFPAVKKKDIESYEEAIERLQ